MLCKFVLLGLLAAAASALQCDVYSDEWLQAEFNKLQPQVADMWNDFHGRGFRVRDVAERRQLFAAAAKLVNAHNAAGAQSFCMRPNHLATISDEEYKSMLGARAPNASTVVAHAPPLHADMLAEGALPATVYWQSGRVENQGACGSCWAFAASHILTATLNTFGHLYPVEFSEQEIIDCVKACEGCNGGWSDKVYDYFMGNPSNLDFGETPYHVLGTVIPDYPQKYVAMQGTCKVQASGARLVKGFEWAPKKSMTKLMTVLAKRPTTIYFDVENASFRYYSHGVYDNLDPGCNADHINHAMGLVGYGASEDGTFWHVKNSWGSGWGKDGYVFVKRDPTRCGPCGICDWPLYPKVSTEK